MAYGNSIQTSRKYPRVTMNVRIPSHAYHSGYADLKRWMGEVIGTQQPLSNSMTVRLALWAMARLRSQTAAAGPEAVQTLAEDMTFEMQRMRAGNGVS